MHPCTKYNVVTAQNPYVNSKILLFLELNVNVNNPGKLACARIRVQEIRCKERAGTGPFGAASDSSLAQSVILFMRVSQTIIISRSARTVAYGKFLSWKAVLVRYYTLSVGLCMLKRLRRQFK